MSLEHELVGVLADRDLVGACSDVPLLRLAVEAGEQPRIGGHGYLARLAGFELDCATVADRTVCITDDGVVGLIDDSARRVVLTRYTAER